VQPRSEPLLWLQCLALGAIPLELLVIRLVLAGADPGPVPGVERFLIWGVGVLAPTVALWRRPADWGSLLLVRQPLASRSSNQLRISALHSGLTSRIAVVLAAVILLPTLWWLDDSAVLASEFSPVSGQSRLVTLLLVSPLLALIVWQLQQLVQATALLIGAATPIAAAEAGFRAEAVATQRTSLGLQLLNLTALDWPDPVPEATPESAGGQSTEKTIEDSVEAEAEATVQATETPNVDVSDDHDSDGDDDAQHESESDQPNNKDLVEAIDSTPSKPQTDDSTEDKSTEQESTDNTPKMSAESADIEPEELMLNNKAKEVGTKAELDAVSSEDDSSGDVSAEDDVEGEVVAAEKANPSASPESVSTASAPVPVEPEQHGEEEEGTALDPEISQVDTVAGGNTEGHREQAETSGGKESEPEQSSEPPPGSL
jgi:hypothetical protein